MDHKDIESSEGWVTVYSGKNTISIVQGDHEVFIDIDAAKKIADAINELLKGVGENE